VTPVAVVGSVALDTVETPHGRRERLLGGSATFFAAAARFFAPVRLVGAVGDDFGPEDEGLLVELGLDTALLDRLPGRTYAWHGRYGSDYANATTIARDTGVFDDYAPQLPATPDLGALFLAAIAPRLQRHVLESWPDIPLAALDTREAWIEEARGEVLELAARVDWVIVNMFELAALTGQGAIEAGVQVLFGRGARGIVVKRGAEGATLFAGGTQLSVPALQTRVVDPTGAGDAFAGGFVATVAHASDGDHADVWARALRHGAALASVTVEGFGLEALATVEQAELEARAGAIEVRAEPFGPCASH
jgi:sugar/nucleoside kinase (ribokinase family)